MCPHTPPCPDAEWPGPRGGPDHHQPPRAGLEPALQRHRRVRGHRGTAPRRRAHSAAPAHRPDLTAGHGGQAPGGQGQLALASGLVTVQIQHLAQPGLRPPFPMLPGCLDRACVSPGSTTTRVRVRAVRDAERIPAPVDHQHVRACQGSSPARDFSGCPGGCSGKASASTARAPAAAAVRQATRAPLLRPPCTSGTAGRPLRRSASMISIQAASCRAGGPGARRPLTR